MVERFEMSAGVEVPPTALDDCVVYAHTWKKFGATHFFSTTRWAGASAADIARRPVGAHAVGLDGRFRALAAFSEALGPDV